MKTLFSKLNLKQFPLVFGIVAFVAILGCGIKHTATESSVNGPSVNLPDGTVLTLKNVSLGYEHEFTFRGKTQRYSYARPGSEPVSSLELWFYQTARPDKEMTRDIFLTVADESGLVHLPHGMGFYQCLQTNCLGERLAETHFDAFPRRAATLTFYIHTVTNSGWMVAGSFNIPNPARGPFPVWQPESLPATRQNGSLEFSLTSLKVRTNALPDAGTEAVFSVMSNGVPASAWQVESIRLIDATGNQLDLWSGDRECAAGSNGSFSATNRWLDLEEPAWKLKAEFSHKADYSTEELATITNVPAEPNTTLGLTWSTKLKGVNVAVKKITWENNWGGNASVEVGMWPITNSFRLALIKVTDEHGQEIKIAKPPRGYGDFSGDNSGYYGLELPSGTKTLDFTFAYQESRFADFTVKPEVASIIQNQPPQ